MRYRYRELDVMTDQTGRRNEETKRNQASETAESAMNFGGVQIGLNKSRRRRNASLRTVRVCELLQKEKGSLPSLSFMSSCYRGPENQYGLPKVSSAYVAHWHIL